MIRVNSLSKKFKLYRSPGDRLKELLLHKPFHTEFWALRDVTFAVANESILGIIGENGSGKSTLLKIMTGIYLPDSGSVHIDGKTTGLLELGTGFNPEMSGIENIFMNGILLGMSREDIDRIKDKIIDFTELGEFIFEPIKTYSSGMAMRLAFSIAIHANPSCFLVDEALSVGDARFQQKCIKEINSFREQGGVIIFVSHDLNAVKIICDRALLLDQGVIAAQGTPEEVVNSYNYLISQRHGPRSIELVKRADKLAYGTHEARIKKISIRGESSGSNIISSGEKANIIVDIEARKNLQNVSIGIKINDIFGRDIYGTNTYYYKLEISMQSGKHYRCIYSMNMNIGTGKYTITAAIHTGPAHVDHCIDWCDNIADFEVAGFTGEFFVGISKMYPAINFEEA